MKVKRITTRHLQFVIRVDEDLDRFVKDTIAGSGVIPHIHKEGLIGVESMYARQQLMRGKIYL